MVHKSGYAQKHAVTVLSCVGFIVLLRCHRVESSFIVASSNGKKMHVDFFLHSFDVVFHVLFLHWRYSIFMFYRNASIGRRELFVAISSFCSSHLVFDGRIFCESYCNDILGWSVFFFFFVAVQTYCIFFFLYSVFVCRQQ